MEGRLLRGCLGLLRESLHCGLCFLRRESSRMSKPGSGGDDADQPRSTYKKRMGRGLWIGTILNPAYSEFFGISVQGSTDNSHPAYIYRLEGSFNSVRNSFSQVLRTDPFAFTITIHNGTPGILTPKPHPIHPTQVDICWR